MKRNFFPISIDLSTERILLIGGGRTALKKLRILQRFDVTVEVLALEICDEIRNCGIRFRQKAYEKSDLNGYLMVYSCSNNPELDRQIAADARMTGVLVNIHDNPELCQFVSPAVWKKDNMTVAVSSNAENVNESIRMRNAIQNFFESNE